MACPSAEIVRVLRVTAARIASQASYQWGHMGQCNCGHLAQTVTRLDGSRIHTVALEREGDWQQQVRDYCPTSGLLIDAIIDELVGLGFTPADLGRLERLTDPMILAELPDGRRHLRRNRREDVVLYLQTWAALLERGLGDKDASRSVAPLSDAAA